MNRLAVLGLWIVAAVLAGVVATELRGVPGQGGSVPVPFAEPPAREALGMPSGVPRQTLVATILARPLFASNRRPPAEAGTARADAGPGTGLPRVAGVLVGPSGRSVIFAAEGTEKPMVMAEGDRVAGFVVQSIAPGQVTLLGPGGMRVLRPTFEPAGARSPPPALVRPAGGLLTPATIFATPPRPAAPPGAQASQGPSAQ